MLTIANGRDALTRLDDDEKGVSSIHTPGGEQQATTINESGLYSMILGSRKPALSFEGTTRYQRAPASGRTANGPFLHCAPASTM